MTYNKNEACEYLSKFPKLKFVISQVDPIHQPGAGNVFNELVKNIAYQQISYKAAQSVYRRFTTLMNTEKYSPNKILDADYEAVRSCGFSYRKTDYIFNIATFFKEKRLYKKDWSNLTDNQIIDLLSQIKGVGVWTVQMILLFELKRPDIFPSLDLAIQYVIKDIYDLKSEKKALVKEIEKISEDWAPYRTLASLYLWGYRRMQLEQKK